MHWRLFLIMTTGGLFTAHAQESPREPLTCEIATTDLGRQVEFQGFVAASAALSGQYRLELNKSGPSGSVTSRQSGTFEAKPATLLPVGRIVISVEEGASYRAILRVEAGEHAYECQKQGLGRAQ